MGQKLGHIVFSDAAFLAIFLFLPLFTVSVDGQKKDARLVVVTVATEETDGLRRLRNSAEEFGHEFEVIGLDAVWRGGDVRRTTGGAQKVRLLRAWMQDQRFDDETLLMFVDGYDVILNAGPSAITAKFADAFDGSRIVFGAEAYCWPDVALAPDYPLITFGERFLNSGIFVGYAVAVEKMLSHAETLKDDDDDQLFYTQLYLDKAIREELGMSLDSMTRIFINLNGVTEYARLVFEEESGKAQVYNALYNTRPLVIHGNGASKLHLNWLGNYLANRYNENEGCIKCLPAEAVDEPQSANQSRFVGLALMIAKPIPYVEEFLAAIVALDYPKESIDVVVYNNQKHNRKEVSKLLESAEVRKYRSVQLIEPERSEREVRTHMLEWAKTRKLDYLFIVDADAHLATGALTSLINLADHHNWHILAPMLVQPRKLFSNFWGALSANGFYARSEDYVEIVERRRVSVWNVPFIGGAVLISQQKIEQLAPAFTHNVRVDADMSFAQYCRENGIFMFVSNEEEYGFLVESEHFAERIPKRSNAELYDFPHNLQLWENRYIHRDYFNLLKPNTEVPLACSDVYDFPFVSERFAKEIIEVMEGYGKWSDGSHTDRRLDGGYENVPTRDIHMNQVGFEKQWLAIMDTYVAPIQEKVFVGFYQRPIRSNMMFVVRYRPDEQNSLRPHHDASTYSIDIALNKKGVDYEGGGVKYIRQNCTIEADQVGWSMLFPGRLTHLHEGLPTVSDNSDTI